MSYYLKLFDWSLYTLPPAIPMSDIEGDSHANDPASLDYSSAAPTWIGEDFTFNGGVAYQLLINDDDGNFEDAYVETGGIQTLAQDVTINGTLYTAGSQVQNEFSMVDAMGNEVWVLRIGGENVGFVYPTGQEPTAGDTFTATNGRDGDPADSGDGIASGEAYATVDTRDGIVTGTTGDDTIDATYIGDPEGDQIDDGWAGGAGTNDNYVDAQGGNDSIDSGLGNDTVLAGDGADTVEGGGGNDNIDLTADGVPAFTVGRWDFDNNADPLDDTATADNDAVLRGDAAHDTANGSVTLDGVGDYIEIADNPAYDIASATIVMDFQLDTLSGTTGLFTKDANGNASGDLTAYANADGSVFLRWQSDTTDYTITTSSGVLQTGVDHSLQISLNNDTGDIELYVDGTLEGSVNAPGATLNGNVNPWVVGGRGWSSTRGTADNVTDTMDGSVSHFEVLNGAYTPSSRDQLVDGAVDTIVFSDGDGDDTVTGFEGPIDNGDGTFTGQDQLDLSGLTDAGGYQINTRDVTVSDDGSGNAVLSFPNGESITLVGIAPSEVSNENALAAMGVPAADDVVEGTAGADTIDASYTGDPDGDMVDAGDNAAGNNDDVITAGAGDDSISPGAGNDTIYGGIGDDTIDAADDAPTGAGTGGVPTAQQIGLWEFNNANPLDDQSLINNDAQLVGNATPDGNGGISLDGSGDYVRIPHDTDYDLQSATVRVNFRMDTLTSTTGILSRDSSGFDGGGHFTIEARSDGTLDLRWQSDTASYNITTAPGAIVPGTDHSIQVAFDNTAGNIEMFLDGVSVGTVVAPVTLEGNAEPWVLGAGQTTSGDATDTGTNEFMDGTVSHFEIWDAVLTPAELDIANAGDVVDGGEGSDFIKANGGDRIDGGENADGTDNDLLNLNDVASIQYYDNAGNKVSGPTENGFVTFNDGSTMEFENIETVSIGDNIVQGTAAGDTIAPGFTDADGTVVDGSDAQGTHGEVVGGQADWIEGGAGDDIIDGGAGNDTIDGGTGADSLTGGAGDDVVYTGAGADTVDTGEGSDTVYLDAGTGSNDLSDSGIGVSDVDTIILNSGTGLYSLQGDFSAMDGFESITGSAATGEVITTDDAAANFDFFNVTLTDIDEIRGTSNADNITASAGADSITGQAGADMIFAGDGDDTIQAGDDADTVYGGTGADLIEGGGGNDNLLGDDFSPSGGNDTIIGGAGDDTLNGAAGDDQLTGGDGNDLFLVSDGNDIITDFGAGETGAVGDGDIFNNDFLNLIGYYDSLDELRADQDDDGILNQSNALDDEGNTVDYSDNTQFGSNSMTVQGASGSSFSYDNTGIVCFTSGTMILTPRGEVQIDSLKPGDLVCTLDNGPQPINWIGRRHCGQEELRERENLRPILIPNGILGVKRDLLVSRQHGMLIGQDHFARAIHLSETMPGVRIAHGKREVTYIHLMFDTHQIIFAEGAPSESFYPGPMAMQMMSREAIRDLNRRFPKLVPSLDKTAVQRIYGDTARPFLKKKELPELLVAA